jgi:hypothetical protein
MSIGVRGSKESPGSLVLPVTPGELASQHILGRRNP